MVDGNPTRRRVLRASAAVAGLGAATGAAAGETETDGMERIGTSDLTAAEDSIETVDASGVAPETSSGIGPGSQLFITRADSSGTSGCTANFVWEGADGTRYLGAAGHCFLPGSADAATNSGGSYDASQVTTRVCIDCTFGGATGLNGLRGRVVELGEVVYARQARGGTQIGEDFGLVRIPSEAEPLIDPSMPTFGGPTEPGTVDSGEQLCHYGNGVATGETFLTKPRTGLGIGHDPAAGSWQAGLAAAPGDSGSAVQGATTTLSGVQGVEAAGVLTHVGTTGVAGTTREKAIEMAAESGLDVDVVYA